MTQMTVGAYCQETAYSGSQYTKDQVLEFQSYVSSKTLDFVFFKYGVDHSSAQSQSGTSENGVTYTFSDIYCIGEVVDTALGCGGLSGTNNNPDVVAYELYSIFEVDTVVNSLSTSTSDAVDTFFVNLYKSLKDCHDQHCSGGGVCRLSDNIWTDSFVDDWDGDFSKLWDINENGNAFCFCDPDRTGESCEFGIACDDDNSCASGYKCAAAGLRDTPVSMCVAQDADLTYGACRMSSTPCPSGYSCQVVPYGVVASYCASD